MSALTPAIGNSVTSDLAPARAEDLEAARADASGLAEALRQGVPAALPEPDRDETLDNVPTYGGPRPR